MANVAPGINYPDALWRAVNNRATLASGTFAGVPSPNELQNPRNDINGFTAGTNNPNSVASGTVPAYDGATMPVQKAAYTLIQNQASG